MIAGRSDAAVIVDVPPAGEPIIRHTSPYADFPQTWPHEAQGQDARVVWAWGDTEPKLATGSAATGSLVEERIPDLGSGIVTKVAAGADGATAVAVAALDNDYVIWRPAANAGLSRSKLRPETVEALRFLAQRPIVLTVHATSRTRGTLYANWL